MLLVIHNLPTNVRYSDLKGLIKDRCNVLGIILDNLVYETPQSRKVTVGLSDEDDAALVLKELDGLFYMGQKLYVTEVQKNKPPGKTPQSSFDQGYSVGNGNQNNEQNKIGVIQQTASVMQKMSASPFGMPTNSPFDYQYNMPYYQDANSQYQPEMPTSDNMMNTQSVATYGSNMGMTQNATVSYSGPSNYTSYQPSMVPHPSETEPDFISFTNTELLNKLGIKNQSESRYFKKNVNEQRPPDKIQGFSENPRGSSGRSDRMSSPRNDRGFNEPRNRSSYYDERRYDVWNRSDEFSGRSGSSSNRPGEDKYSNRNQSQSMDLKNQSYSRNYRYNPDSNKYDYKDKTDYGDYNKDSSSRRIGNEYHHPSSMQTNKPGDNIYSLFNGRSYGNSIGSLFDTYKPQKDNEYKRSNFGSPVDKNRADLNRKADDYQRKEPITYPIHDESNKFDYNRGPSVQESRSPTNVPTETAKYQKYVPSSNNFNQVKSENPGTLSLRDQTWRNQAVSALVQHLLASHQMEYVKTKSGFMPHIKNLVRLRIDNMFGKTVSVNLDKILEEYRKKYPMRTQKSFLIDAMNECRYNKLKKKDYKSQGNVAPAQAGSAKRKVPETFQMKPGSIKKFKMKPEQQNIVPPQLNAPQPTKYQNSNKKGFKELKKLAREEFEGDLVYKLQPKMHKALEDEVKVLVDMFNEECTKNAGGEEARVCQRIMKVSEKFKKIIMLDCTKRILNITWNLLVRIYSRPKIKVRELTPLVQSVGIASLRRSARSKFFIAICDSYQSFDRLCSTVSITLDGYTLRFRPLHLAGPMLRKKTLGENNKNDGDDGEDTGDDDDFDDEEYGDEDGDEGDEDGEDDDDGEDSDGEDNDNKDANKTDGDDKGMNKDILKDTPVDESTAITTEIIDKTPVKIESSEKGDEKIVAADTNNFKEKSDTKGQGNEEYGNNPEPTNTGTENECFDVANIAQEDLEDF